ncbi:hypothetical protein BpHYR1_015867 [Brachionus plicatilis]|uniref:Uncharacterized protein n=1 Tax=Brachionus plicatilis TaxID=10195 RepID=A0A3M7P260_BRAPC|nr:hypothetical protein BpHYR1_015867 [Brachionus plicatilis]
MDCGKHFRNCEVVGYLLKDLAKEKIHVNLNFFCEKHGKNQRDSTFSCISRFLNAESLKRRLCSTKDIHYTLLIFFLFFVYLFIYSIFINLKSKQLFLNNNLLTCHLIF